MIAETVIMGMGKTGIASLRFLVKQGIAVRIMDNRQEPPYLSTVMQEFPQVAYQVGHFNSAWLAAAQEIVISPGLSLQEPALSEAKAKNIPIISEIELFARYVNAPVVAITGSNGKSTVTTLVGEMAQQAGWRVAVGGNLGTPALDLLQSPAPNLYVLELSSFQLETTYSLKPKAAVVLNVSEDHMDRYANLEGYIAAKRRIYEQADTAVINLDDANVVAMLQPHHKHLSFSLHSHRGNFTMTTGKGGKSCLAYLQDCSIQPLLAIDEIRLQGAVMRSNILAALALGEAVGLPMSAMLDAVREFRGLPHRCEWVATIKGVDWFNDSKGTNVGASVAAIQGLERAGRIILIAGGEGKGADFTPLAPIASQHLKACVLIGRDAHLIAKALEQTIPLIFAKNMFDAVQQAAQLATTGDAVLLSPACASFDMFNSYAHRGEVFVAMVQKLIAISDN